MSLSSFSAQDRERATRKPYVVEPYTPKPVEPENPNHPIKQFRGENLDLRVYYSIGQVAEMFNVAPSLIRFWEQEFGLEIKKSRKGDRQFTKQDVEEIGWIYHLVKVRLFTLAGAKLEMERQSVDVRGEQA